MRHNLLPLAVTCRYRPPPSESFYTLPLALAFRAAASENFMLVSSKTVQKCAAKTRKIHLHPFEFKENLQTAGISPCRNGVVVLVPANLPTVFVGVHVGTWFYWTKREGRNHVFLSDFGILWTILDFLLVPKGRFEVFSTIRSYNTLQYNTLTK